MSRKLAFCQKVNDHFEEVFRQQHRILALGTDGDQSYNGHHPNRDLKDIMPGVFVFDEDYLDGLINGGGIASPAAQINFFEVTTMDILNSETTKLLAAELHELKDLPDFYTLEVDGIPEEDLPTNELKDDHSTAIPAEMKPYNYSHAYPKLPFYDPMSGRRAYFERAKQLMLQFLEEPNVQTKIVLLASYYHVAINGHFFVAGNNSVLMAQVNVILESLGYRPLNHGVLDYLALLLSTRRFVKVLRNRLVPAAGAVQ
jgi:hypothetical protein